MKVARTVVYVLLALCAASFIAVTASLIKAIQLRGQWSAVVMIVDGVVLGYALLMICLGFSVRKALGKASRHGMVWFAVWSLLGPVPVTLYAVFHGIKMFA
jgi:hypothetical protein